MDNSIKALGKIRESIISGGINESQLRNLMDKLKNEYGDDVFKSYDLNSVRQYIYSKPYYERLIQLAKNGACSQEFFLHLLRVRNELKKQSIIKNLKIIGACVFMCITILTFLMAIKNSVTLKKIEGNIPVESEISENLEKENTGSESLETVKTEFSVNKDESEGKESE